MLKLNQKNFDTLVDNLNHKMTSMKESINNMKTDIKWMKYIGYYLSGIFTLALIGSVF